MSFLKGLFAAIILILLAACGPDNGDNAGLGEHSYVITIGDDDHGFRVTLPDGSVFTDADAYADAFPSILRYSRENDDDIAFRFHQRIADDVDESVNVSISNSDNADVHVSVTNKSNVGVLEQPLRVDLPGRYVLTTSYQTKPKFVNGCVSAWSTPTANIRLHRKTEPEGTQIWNMHAAAYQREGRQCLGLYESVGGWTKCTCVPTYGETVSGIAASLVAVGITAGTARIIAQAVTPAIVVIAISPVP